ncbi:SDR family NAD(P)-dependent oxidoreductase [Actinoallomurus rhizosphaericola]|uniref:SDR family NAD(P)-dependent oxidoreductase n=1 Tax=Actinoallomurus rhizosphaericola TaxID=2952536 RepID=UPI002091D8E4|nr:SDR family NAD(P)-dependent oxidoreductase [Actinoallomurus rhizosphaericola]MCO5994434.1 SDR family NAD(P)-dependent oxidoreductase [Actinoallomurus rhizosphaericola]
MTNTGIALVTGATAGLGRAVATGLAEHGMHVLVHGRDADRAADVVGRIEKAGGTAEAYLADLASLAQARELADRVSADHGGLRLLVNNAGIGAGRPPYRRRRLSADGHELRFAVNYLAPALLARLLTPALREGAPARIVNVGSVGQAPIDFTDLRMDTGYTGAQAYYRSKFALAAFTFDLADELAGDDVTVNCLHPATFMNTHMVRESMMPPMSTVGTGARAVLNLAAGPAGGAVTGRYFDGESEARAHEGTYDPAIRARLRAVTAELLEPFLGG